MIYDFERIVIAYYHFAGKKYLILLRISSANYRYVILKNLCCLCTVVQQYQWKSILSSKTDNIEVYLTVLTVRKNDLLKYLVWLKTSILNSSLSYILLWTRQCSDGLFTWRVDPAVSIMLPLLLVTRFTVSEGTVRVKIMKQQDPWISTSSIQVIIFSLIKA